jgi:hypothetical protein
VEIENSTYEVGSLKLGLLYEKVLEYGVPKLQEIKCTHKVPTTSAAVGSGDRW